MVVCLGLGLCSLCVNVLGVVGGWNGYDRGGVVWVRLLRSGMEGGRSGLCVCPCRAIVGLWGIGWCSLCVT